MFVDERCEPRSSPCAPLTPLVSASILPLFNLTAALGGDAQEMTDGPFSQSSQRCAWQPFYDWWPVCRLLIWTKQLINLTSALLTDPVAEKTPVCKCKTKHFGLYFII